MQGQQPPLIPPDAFDAGQMGRWIESAQYHLDNFLGLDLTDTKLGADQFNQPMTGRAPLPATANPQHDAVRSLMQAISGEGGGSGIAFGEMPQGAINKILSQLDDPKVYAQKLRFLAQAPNNLLSADSNLGELIARVMFHNMTPEMQQYWIGGSKAMPEVD